MANDSYNGPLWQTEYANFLNIRIMEIWLHSAEKGCLKAIHTSSELRIKQLFI